MLNFKRQRIKTRCKDQGVRRYIGKWVAKKVAGGASRVQKYSPIVLRYLLVE